MTTTRTWPVDHWRPTHRLDRPVDSPSLATTPPKHKATTPLTDRLKAAVR